MAGWRLWQNVAKGGKSRLGKMSKVWLKMGKIGQKQNAPEMWHFETTELVKLLFDSSTRM
jgi:hypothetical protein